MHISWDLEVDTPATIAVLGSGPLAIETALYGRFLGYTVFVYEPHRLGGWLRGLPDDSFFCYEWSQLCSPLAEAALQAQGTRASAFDVAAPSLQQYLDEYLIPCAKTDILYDSIQVQTRV